LDGDIDIIASVCAVHRIIWLENDGQQNFSTNTVTSGFSRPHNISIADMDNDGDQDILGTAINLNQVAWFENNDNEFTKHIVSNSFGGATCVYATDIDKDGDKDILGTAQFDNQIKWWENDLITGFDVETVNNSKQLSCLKNYPNPFTFSTIITYTILKKANVVLKIYDLKANEVTILINEVQLPGNRSVAWDGTDSNNNKVSLGIYYCALTTGNNIETLKIIKY